MPVAPVVPDGPATPSKITVDPVIFRAGAGFACAPAPLELPPLEGEPPLPGLEEFFGLAVELAEIKAPLPGEEGWTLAAVVETPKSGGRGGLRAFERDEICVESQNVRSSPERFHKSFLRPFPQDTELIGAHFARNICLNVSLS